MPRPLRTHAIELRKELTPAEHKLWAIICNDQLRVNFRRHCPRRHQAVRRHESLNAPWQIHTRPCLRPKETHFELDGSQHLEHEDCDEERTKYLNAPVCKVIRFWNNDVTNKINGVILAILDAVEDEVSKD